MLKIVYEDKEATVDLVTVDRRIWLDKDGKPVEDGDPTAKRLYCAPGDRIRKADAEAVGIKLTPAPAKTTAKKAAPATAKQAAKTTTKKTAKKAAKKTAKKAAKKRS
ncbi:hypothetical protein LCGC14_2268680 [marine sediment metagenome]|uniref:Uncharacterized protein n=1 Tax=marine sediment metagenome TaxID=412755 RepID=A0A0F9FSM9_9ZZZZ